MSSAVFDHAFSNDRNIKAHRRTMSQQTHSQSIVALKRSLSLTHPGPTTIASTQKSAPMESESTIEVTSNEEMEMLQDKPKVMGILKGTRTDNSNLTSKNGSKQFRFNEIVFVGEALGAEEYERKSDFVLHLTPTSAFLIKQELNQFKSEEMPVHAESKHYTHLFTL